MEKGLAGVALLAAVAVFGVLTFASREEDRWDGDRREVVQDNASRAGTRQEPLADPGEPFVVRHSVWLAIGTGLVVAVFGTIIVLLFAIASGQRRD